MESTGLETKLKEVFVVGGVSGFGYALTVAYEAGYLGHFAVPTNFIEVSIVSVLVVLGILGVTLFPLMGMWNVVFTKTTDDTHPIIATLKDMAKPLLWLVSIYWISGTLFEPQSGRILIGTLGLFFVLHFIVPIFTVKKKKYLERLREVNSREVDWGIKDDLFTRFAKSVGISLYRAVIYAAVAIYIAVLIGGARAKQLENHYVLSGSNLVVLRAYSERIILAPYDPTTRTVSRSLTVISAKPSDKPLVFEFKTIGRLTAEGTLSR